MAIAILGLGKTGRSLAKYFLKQGKEVWGIDDRPELAAEPNSESFLPQELFLGGKLPPLEQAERFFISPGVDPKHPAARQAQKLKLRLEGELDLAFSLGHGEIAALTGTNGKSTTTALLGEMSRASGVATAVGGNLGTPYLDLVTDETQYQRYILEVSSFQLETIREFRPKVAVLLNLSEDHFERHENLSQYLQAKSRIFSRQSPQDFAVYNDDDLRVLEAIEKIPSKPVPFSTAKKVAGAYGDENQINWAPQGEILSKFNLAQCSLTGLHNLENISAAVAAAKCLEIADDPIQQALNTFQGLPHRIERVRVLNQVEYYDDSKATNVGAVVMSLASFDKDVVLIMGGKDKGGDYRPLRPLLKAKARAVLVLGEAKEKILEELAGATELISVQDMAEAVRKAHQMAAAGGTVLLSPACSSFDMYRDYHERGEDFKNNVKSLESDRKSDHRPETTDRRP